MTLKYTLNGEAEQFEEIKAKLEPHGVYICDVYVNQLHIETIGPEQQLATEDAIREVFGTTYYEPYTYDTPDARICVVAEDDDPEAWTVGHEEEMVSIKQIGDVVAETFYGN